MTCSPTRQLTPGLEAPEIASTIESGLSAGLKRPRAWPERLSAPKRPATLESRDKAGLAARPEPLPGGPGSLKADTAPTKAPKNIANPHTILDAAIEQAQAAAAYLEATRADGRHPTYKRASAGAVHNDRPAYWAEPKVNL